jgi:hypothetical protein
LGVARRGMTHPLSVSAIADRLRLRAIRDRQLLRTLDIDRLLRGAGPSGVLVGRKAEQRARGSK